MIIFGKRDRQKASVTDQPISLDALVQFWINRRRLEDFRPKWHDIARGNAGTSMKSTQVAGPIDRAEKIRLVVALLRQQLQPRR